MQKKKKIVLLGVAHPFRGGLASYNHRLVREYQKLGYDIELSTFTLQYPSILFPGKTQLSPSPKPDDIEIIEEVNSINPFNWIKVGRRIKKLAPDLLLLKFWLPFMGPCFGTIARIAKANGKTKVITVIDNIVPHEKRIGDRTLSQYFVNANDGFVAMSHEVMRDLGTFDTKKPRLYSPHPIFDNFGEKLTRDQSLQALNLDPNYRYMLFFGFVRDYKGLDLLLEAFGDDRFREKPIKLIVAGEFYNNSQQYFDQIKRLKLENHVIMHNDYIPNEKVKEYFCVSDIIAQPYKSATQSGVTQIGYHFEKSMLVTNVGGLAEIIPHHKVGYVVEPNPQVIADALIHFYENEKQEAFEQNLIEEKKKYDWKTMVEAVDEIYDQL